MSNCDTNSKLFSTYFVRWIKVCTCCLLISGCGGGEGTKPDGGGGGSGGGGSGTEALGALVIVGLATWGIAKVLSSKEEQESKFNDNLEMYLVPVTNNVYEQWNDVGDEPQEFGVYTYVLFGKYPTQGELSKRYEAILDIVQEKPYWPEYKKPVLSKDRGQDISSDIDTANMNVYLIPVDTKNSQRIVTISSYDFDLSMRILQRHLSKRVSPEYREKFFSKGPFLISLPHEVHKDWKQHVLFADFSNVSEEMFLEMFNSYERALKLGSDSKMDPFGTLENIRIDLGQMFIDFNAPFKIIGEASAEE